MRLVVVRFSWVVLHVPIKYCDLVLSKQRYNIKVKHVQHYMFIKTTITQVEQLA
jgi:hypothetical protein